MSSICGTKEIHYHNSWRTGFQSEKQVSRQETYYCHVMLITLMTSLRQNSEFPSSSFAKVSFSSWSLIIIQCWNVTQFEEDISDSNHSHGFESTCCNQCSMWNATTRLSSGISAPQMEDDLQEVWNKTGHQGNEWRHAEVPLRKLRNFVVIFEGIRSKDVSGGAAIDDLEFIDCSPSKCRN